MKHLYLLLCLVAFSLKAQISPENIQIARDRWGVPHIFGKTDAEVAYGLAWAHAEDDFSTIQLTLLSGKGMLGRLKGKQGATIDYVVSLLRCRDIVEEQYESALSPEFKALISGYVEGLNAFARQHPGKVLLREAFPVTTRDYMTAIVLSLSVISGVDEVLSNVLKGNLTTLENFKATGSNAIAIARQKTADGAAYLAINSHQPLEGPVAWYEAHLCSEEGLNILGGLFPGGPVVFHGVNEHLGWAHTVNAQDKIDVFQLETAPGNSDFYVFDGQREKLETRKISLKVKMGPLKITIRKKAFWSRYGATLKTPRGVFAIRLGANQDIRGVEQWYRMNKARNFSDFYQAMEMVAIPGFNTVYADRYDTLFYVSNGKIPVRQPGHDWKNTVAGNTSSTLWASFYPLKALPQYLNPPSGYLFNTNHSPFRATAPTENLKAESFPAEMGYETFDNNRSIRLRALIEKQDRISYQDFKAIKYDGQYPDSLYFPVDINPLFHYLPDETALKPLAGVLKNWDRKSDTTSRGAAIFLVAYQYIRELLRNGRLLYGQTLSTAQCHEVLQHTYDHFIKHFGNTEVRLGELQQLVRGTNARPVWGLPDVITAMHAQPYSKGQFRVTAGESYIELVRFYPDRLPGIESIIHFGASSDPSSPHYLDQRDVFLHQQTKKMTLDKSEVLKTAVSIYPPVKP